MRMFKHLLRGLVTVASFIGGATMVTPLGSDAEASMGYHFQAASFEESQTEYQLIFVTDRKHNDDDDDQRLRVRHTDLRGDHENIDGKQNMIKESLDVMEGNQAKTHEWLEKIETAIAELEPGVAGPPCEAGTEGQRFVTSVDNPEVCDNHTGLSWVKAPDATARTHAEAITHCATLDLSNGQTYRLPTLGEMTGVADSTQLSPPSPGEYPVISEVFSPALLFSFFWSASSNGRNPPDAWVMNFRTGGGSVIRKTNRALVWCARSGP